MLRMRKLTDYAFVLLAHMARNDADATWVAQDLSEATRVPLPTTAKVLKRLARHDLLTSRRGASGGYWLSRAPAAITVADVIEALEGPLAITECVASLSIISERL